MKTSKLLILYPLFTGILLGLIQTGLFFQLSLSLSSAFITYLMITLCWLLGSAIGAYYVSRLKISLRTLLIMTIGLYLLVGWLVSTQAFNSNLLPLYAFLIALAGFYPGVFFARTSKIMTTRLFFFWENNGFILGLVICTLFYMLMGRSILLWIPIACAIMLEYVQNLLNIQLRK